MALNDELLALKPLLGTDAPDFYTKVKDISARYNSNEDKKTIADFISEQLRSVDEKLNIVEEKAIKLQLQEISEIISLSWIAKKYFGKTKNWLYQRINENTVNGKPCRFTDEEIKIFNHALKDISQKIGSLSLSY